MRELLLDAAQWSSRDDVYDSFFRAVGAPLWHGRNFNALRDSIATGQINQVEVPYRIVIKNHQRSGEGVKEMISEFVDLLQELGARGCPVQVRLEP
jgi:RNAse (barnase) inhibitor barstar